VIGSVKFSAEKPLKLTYKPLLFKKFFRLAYARHKGKGRGEERMGGEDRGGVGEGGEGMEGTGREGAVPDCKNEDLAFLIIGHCQIATLQSYFTITL
jgi:hypothetical protein